MLPPKEELKKWKEAGKEAARLLSYARKIVKSGMPLLELIEKIEEKAKHRFAFPTNLSVDNIAAHYSPCYKDRNVAKGLLKIDLGINIDGFISDTACSVDLTEEKKHEELIKASEKALKEAIKIIKPGIKLCEIGKTIEDTIRSFGFLPIKNLTGHEIRRWKLHGSLKIPNYDDGSNFKLEEGMIIAVEPFATYGEGLVVNDEPSCIYRQLTFNYPIRDKKARKLLEFIEKNYKGLPFSSRWLVNCFGNSILVPLSLLEKSQILYRYPLLVEKTKAAVSQTEHTVLVTKNGCVILTKES